MVNPAEMRYYCLLILIYYFKHYDSLVLCAGEFLYCNITGGEKRMPSEKILSQKKQIVADLAECLKNAQAGVLFDYRGLTVEQDTALRNELRAAGVDYHVVKNTLTRLAANEVGLNELDEVLHGPTALATSAQDALAPARVLAKFVKDNADVVSIKSGFMDGKVISVDEVNVYASIPSKEVLISKMLGSLQAPISKLARTLDAIAKKDGEAAAE